MMVGLKEKYGMGWPEDMPDALIDLKVWKHWREPEYAACTEKEPWECFWRAIYSLVPRKEFVRHEWSEQHVYDWTTEKFLITWGCAASGKAARLDSVVMTPFGPRTMGDIQVGDRVLAQDGKTAEVIKTHDVGAQEEYRVSFQDGTSTICAPDHLWEVEDRRSSGWTRPHVITTTKLADLCRTGRGMYSIPLCEPVYFKPSPVRIDPYVLGCLLGDGSLGGLRQSGLTFTCVDSDILAEVKARLEPGYVLKSRRNGKDFGLSAADTDASRGSNKYISALRHYGLWGTVSDTKFVPKAYLYNSERVRREVLSGLLDTDGGVGASGAVHFDSASGQLAADVQFLVQSLGGMATVTRTKAGYKKTTGEYVPCKDSYAVRISLKDTAGLFKCARKAVRLRSGRRGANRRYIVGVEKTGASAPMKCITIDHPRGLYLTNDFIVTHNSNDMGLLTLIDWMVDPQETVAILASTSLQMLKIRSYESVLRYFHHIKHFSQFEMPGKLRKTDNAIILDEDDELGAATDKASIRGVAVAEGTEQEARTKLTGAHLPYVRLILDELSQMRPAAMRVRTNLSIGAKDFKLVGLCNPDSFTDLAAQYSKPILPGGFAAIDPETTHEWHSPYGKIRRHDGLRSPAILYPEKKLTFLLTKEKLDDIRKDVGGNEDDPEFWTMVRGFPPAQGKKQTLLSMAEVLRSGSTEDVTWMGAPSVTVLGCDPAFSEGGNRAVMQALEIGIDKNNQVKLSCLEPRYVRIDASSAIPVTDQVGDAIKEYAEELSVKPELIGVDDSATQSVADYLQSKHFMTVRRFVSNAAASDMPLSKGDVRKASDRFKNQSTELWAAVAAFVRAGQVRNVPLVAMEQLCGRPLERVGVLRRLLSKKKSTREGNELKAGESPDEQDALSIAFGVVRFVLNMLAGADTISNKYAGPWGRRPGGPSGFRRLAQRYDLDARAYKTAAV